MDCVFCKIAAKEIPSYSIYESDRAWAFLDINPRAPGHAMVIPKSHAANILELPEAEVGPLFLAVKEVAAKIEKALHPDGLTIGINHGEASGQTVKHLHVHVIPRWQDDGGRSIHSVVDNKGGDPVEEMARRILAA